MNNFNWMLTLAQQPCFCSSDKIQKQISLQSCRDIKSIKLLFIWIFFPKGLWFSRDMSKAIKKSRVMNFKNLNQPDIFVFHTDNFLSFTPKVHFCYERNSLRQAQVGSSVLDPTMWRLTRDLVRCKTLITNAWPSNMSFMQNKDYKFPLHFPQPPFPGKDVDNSKHRAFHIAALPLSISVP